MEQKIDKIIQTVQDHYKIPGLSLTVIQDGKVILTKGYGIKDLVTKEPVTEHTQFGIGSITKSFTSALLAGLLQQRRDVTWDTPVSKILGPGFEFGDELRTSRASLRDLLAHRMGVELGETDFAWMCRPMDRQQLITQAKHIPLAADLRTKMMYNNLMYGIAGSVAETLGGDTWEELVKQRFFDILGMANAGFIDQLDATDDLAKPHMAVKGELKQIDLDVHRSVGFVGPCGSIVASASDMGRWMLFHLGRGEIDNLPLIPAHFLSECHKPQFVLPRGKPEWSGYASKPAFPATETRDAYAMGWYCGTYREYHYIAHAGELFGYDSLMTLYPEMKGAIYTCFNGPGGEPAFICNQILHYYISDIILGMEPWLSEETICTFPEPWKSRDSYYPFRIHTEIHKDIPASRQYSTYVGSYKHDFLGVIKISDKEGTLIMEYGKIGKFELYPNGVKDEFRLIGVGSLEFLHQVDLYSPSDWMMVNFQVAEGTDSDQVLSLCCSLFESGPMFVKQSENNP